MGMLNLSCPSYLVPYLTHSPLSLSSFSHALSIFIFSSLLLSRSLSLFRLANNALSFLSVPLPVYLHPSICLSFRLRKRIILAADKNVKKLQKLLYVCVFVPLFLSLLAFICICEYVSVLPASFFVPSLAMSPSPEQQDLCTSFRSL